MAVPGQRILAADFAGEEENYNGTNISGFTSTSFSEPSTVCGIIFTAPTSGKVEITAGANGEFNDGSDDNNNGNWTFHVRAGSSIGSGATVWTPTTDAGAGRIGDRLAAGDQAFGGQAGYRVSGLTPGSTYNATVVFIVTGGSIDIFAQWIMSRPCQSS